MERELSQEALQAFELVNVKGTKPGSYRVPDFLIIGPQRTGTTWLARHLALHEEVFIPAEKELYYFNYLLEKQGPLYSSDKLSWYLGKFQHSLMDFLRLNAMNMKMMHGLPRETLNWFRYRRSSVFGEATASYAAMEHSLVEEVVRLNPEVKVIMMIRNPVDRAWSHAKKDLVKRTGRKLSDVPFDEFTQFYQHEYQMRCAMYSDNIAKWREFIPDEHFFIKRFGDIKSQPNQLFDDICRFIGVMPQAASLIRQGQVINPTGVPKVPEAHAHFLQGLFADELQRLSNEYGIE